MDQWQAKQSEGHAVSRRKSAAECRKDFQSLKGVPSSQKRVETPEERQTAMKAPRKRWQEGSQESTKMAPSDQQDIERPLASRERLTVRRARVKRALNSLQVAPIIVIIGERTKI